MLKPYVYMRCRATSVSPCNEREKFPPAMKEREREPPAGDGPHAVEGPHAVAGGPGGQRPPGIYVSTFGPARAVSNYTN
jgi:hypothetical protein